ncbi:DNA-binding MarR family transcriptional regulator [Nocardia transvalensis]|uniref:DNA-binding MarR family transcriptional regulator n=1 Tax=Nocardia transvalensis TaxID=37333 RepID=A0A7W9P8W1_9NOCA|nr:MarR family transcriptional regulator [Nocardia transvalensis]MBB5911309.1 DNA-binding MarR family transcriptional regulator [Nocardia transvalensis]
MTADTVPTSAQIAEAWQRELPGARTESIGIITPLWRVAGLLSDERQRTLRRLDIDESTLDLLSTLRRAGPPYQLTTRQITARSLVTAGAISQRLARAEAAGLITRARTTASRRGILVTLTPAGHTLIERAVRDLLDYETALTDRLPADQRTALAAALHALAKVLAPEHEI